MKNVDMIPKDRRQINVWCRYYYQFHPVVANFINDIVSVVYSDFTITGNRREISKYRQYFFNNGKFKHDFVAQNIVKEFNLIGETFVSENILLNPDYVEINKSVLDDSFQFSIIPDDDLKKLLTSKNKADIKLRKSLDKRIIKSIKENKNISISSNSVFCIQRLNSPYDLRGTSRVVKYLKVLLDDDKTKENRISGLIQEEKRNKTFTKELRLQRQYLENYIMRVFEEYRKENKLKTLPVIHWNNNIEA